MTISVLDFYQALGYSLGLELYHSKTKMFFSIQRHIKQLVQEQKKNLIIELKDLDIQYMMKLEENYLLVNFIIQIH